MDLFFGIPELARVNPLSQELLISAVEGTEGEGRERGGGREGKRRKKEGRGGEGEEEEGRRKGGRRKERVREGREKEREEGGKERGREGGGREVMKYTQCSHYYNSTQEYLSICAISLAFSLLPSGSS